MSTPTLLHEKVSNFMASIVTTRYGESYVLKVPGLQGVLSTETKREFVGPLPAPNDPSSHVRRQIGPALLVPDGAVILSFPDLLRCKNNILRSKYGEHVVGIFEKGFYEPWEHVLYRVRSGLAAVRMSLNMSIVRPVQWSQDVEPRP